MKTGQVVIEIPLADNAVPSDVESLAAFITDKTLTAVPELSGAIPTRIVGRVVETKLYDREPQP